MNPPLNFYKNLNAVINGAEYETFKKLKIMKLTERGTIALFDKNFMTVEQGLQTSRLIKQASEIKEILKHAFLISPEFVELYF